MRTTLSAAVILLSIGAPAIGQRLDEYLQATLITVGKDRVQAQIRLTPGVAVLPVVLGNINIAAYGSISAGGQRAYAERVRRDLSLTLDKTPTFGSQRRTGITNSRSMNWITGRLVVIPPHGSLRGCRATADGLGWLRFFSPRGVPSCGGIG